MSAKEDQSLSTKQGEIKFRRKLASQQCDEGATIVFSEAHTHEEILEIMEERVAVTRRAVTSLLRDGLNIPSYLELGAERCQRALLFENEFNIHGIAVDISFEMLRFAEVVARHLGYEKMPVRICCDAYNLPIQDNALLFTFCYQTLHHFPDPAPICREIARVLGNQGVLYFDEEPTRGSVKQLLRLHHRRGYRLGPLERLLDKLHLLSIVSKADELECEHGILEEEFDLKTWQNALSPFQCVRMIVNKKLGLHLNGFGFSVSKIVAQMVGGNIEVICNIEKKEQTRMSSYNPLESLRCPNCLSDHPLDILPPGGRQRLSCSECGQSYPEVDGVIFLFEYSLGHKLYPEVYL